MLDLVIKAFKNPKRAIEKSWSLLSREKFEGLCTVCGTESIMYKQGNNLGETYKCKACGAIARHRHLAIELCKVFGIEEPYAIDKFIEANSDFKIYEAQAFGAINDRLKKLDGYVSSEYYPEILKGEEIKDGIRCEDLQNLTFEDESFDLVITQAVFEHIREPDSAWKEIFRVLKPSGYHVFSIPIDSRAKTESRVRIENREEIHIKHKAYHKDGTRKAFVYTDFGTDVAEYLNKFGFSTRISSFEDLDQERFRIYNGYVFISQKT